MTTKSEPRQMTLDEIEAQVHESVGNDWHVMVLKKENGHIQIRTTRKNA